MSAARSAVEASGVTSGSHERRDCLAASRAVAGPPGVRLRGALALPHRDRARCGPRHDPVDADLGEHLDGQLAALALGQRLHDRDGRLGALGAVERHRRETVKTRLPVEATSPVTEVPRPSVSMTCSPSRSRRTATAWCASSPVTSTTEPTTTPPSDSTRWTGRDISPGRRRGAGRTSTCGAPRPGRRACSSPRIAASSRSSSSWRGSSRVGVSTAMLTTRSPRPPRRLGTPKPRITCSLPDCVPGRISRSNVGRRLRLRPPQAGRPRAAAASAGCPAPRPSSAARPWCAGRCRGG